jgi:hypothetical protein
MRAISSGTQKSKGTTWHPELADKVSRMRNHLYWAMDHCNGDEATLKRHLDSAIEHFQMRHDGCDPTSVCCQPGYAPDYVVLQDPVAILLLTNFVRRSAIYRKPADYVYGRDTYLVESFNNVVLLYLDKRIHYRDLTYEMRRNLAVLDWNEHVSRDHTSVWHAWTDGYEKRGTEKKKYKPKSFCYVEQIWQALLSALSLSDNDTPPPADSDTSSEGTIAYSLPSSNESCDTAGLGQTSDTVDSV